MMRKVTFQHKRHLNRLETGISLFICVVMLKVSYKKVITLSEFIISHIYDVFLEQYYGSVLLIIHSDYDIIARIKAQKS